MTIPHPSKPIVLIHLAASVQGRAVVRAALARGFPVRALMRDRARASTLPSAPVEWDEANLNDADAPRAASAGVGHAVLQVPIGPADTMAAQAGRSAAALADAGLRSVVLKLANVSRPAPCVEPSFVDNARVEEPLRRAGLACATVRPTMHLDNLLKPSARWEIIDNGVFAPPIASPRPRLTTAPSLPSPCWTWRRHGRLPHRGSAESSVAIDS